MLTKQALLLLSHSISPKSLLFKVISLLIAGAFKKQQNNP
jgi:hypothetical protein